MERTSRPVPPQRVPIVDDTGHETQSLAPSTVNGRGAADRQKHLVDGDGEALPAAFSDTALPTADSPAPAPKRASAGKSDESGLEPGQLVHQYELIRKIGRGGMGTVYLARDTKLARRVAIKFLHNNGPVWNQRFQTEARTTARCRHDNIVVIYDINEYRESPFMVLEYLEGQSLRQFTGGKALSSPRALDIMVPVIRALKCAHEHGIVHRDLKPENIFVTTSGAVKVLDFGIAKLVSNSIEQWDSDPNAQLFDSGPSAPLAGAEALPDSARVTRPGALIGTLPYMSPEQLRGEEVDYRADLWAAGIILYELLAGRHPLAPITKARLRAVAARRQEPMPSARDTNVAIEDKLADIIDHCLLKDKEQRIGSAAELLDALEALVPQRQRYRLADDECPYPGLLAFQKADADRYFGREHDVVNVLAHLRKKPLLGVVGPTGIGKSSFLRAGVMPALEGSDEHWDAIIIRPGLDPLHALASAMLPFVTGTAASLTRPLDEHRALVARLKEEPGYLGRILRRRSAEQRSKILLVVDPFEELYTLTRDPNEQRTFTACLTGAADDAAAPVRVIIAMRSDFLDRIAEDRRFMGELAGNLIFLAPPDRQGLEEALTRPAEMAGYRFEGHSLVDAIVSAVEKTPNSLPLLQFAASRLWEARDRSRKLLTEASYLRIGGVVGALTSHADQVVDTISHMSLQALAITKTIFQRLVTPERTRTIAAVDELCQLAAKPDDVQSVLDRLVVARLLVVHTDAAEGPAVEIVHDSLIHSWPRLRRWLDENEEDVAFLAQLSTAAKQWQTKGKPQGLLWRGEARDEAHRWRQRYEGPLSKLQDEYLEAVFALANRTRRIKRIIIAGTMLLLALIAAGSVTALLIYRNVKQYADSKAVEVESKSAALGLANQLVEDRELKLEQQNQRLIEENQRAEAAKMQAVEESRRARAAEALTQAEKERAEEESKRARLAEKQALEAKQRAEAAEAKARSTAAELEQALRSERELRRKENERLKKFEERFGKGDAQGLR